MRRGALSSRSHLHDSRCPRGRRPLSSHLHPTRPTRRIHHRSQSPRASNRQEEKLATKRNKNKKKNCRPEPVVGPDMLISQTCLSVCAFYDLLCAFCELLPNDEARGSGHATLPISDGHSKLVLSRLKLINPK